EISRARKHSRDCLIVALDRHTARQANSIADEVHATWVQQLRVRRDRIINGRENQTERRLGGRGELSLTQYCRSQGNTSDLQKITARADHCSSMFVQGCAHHTPVFRDRRGACQRLSPLPMLSTARLAAWSLSFHFPVISDEIYRRRRSDAHL